jgi:quercetin dioxygenase-like cupin family protein
MLKQTILQIGDLKGVIFDFPEVNDILPEHVHTEENVHITIVARGKILARFGGQEKIIQAGDVFNWEVGEPHEFVSLVENSRLVNINKNYQINGKPINKNG